MLKYGAGFAAATGRFLIIEKVMVLWVSERIAPARPWNSIFEMFFKKSSGR